jgi:hypothetical protein
MKLPLLAAVIAISLSSAVFAGEDMFNYVDGQQKIACQALTPAGLNLVYVQTPEANGAPIAGSKYTVAIQNSDSRVSHIGMNKSTETTLVSSDGKSSFVALPVDPDTTPPGYLMATLLLSGTTYTLLCQQAPGGLAGAM